MNIKEQIRLILEHNEVIKEVNLIANIMALDLKIKREEILLAVSELLQENLIIRLEYLPPDSAFRSIIYFPFGTRF